MALAIMSNCLLSLVASLPGIIVIWGLIALFCIVLFDTTPAHGRTKAVKRFREPGKIECGSCNVTANPNAPQEDIEFDTNDLVVKVEKKISPDSRVNTLCIFLEIISGTSQKTGHVRSTTVCKNRKSK